MTFKEKCKKVFEETGNKKRTKSEIVLSFCCLILSIGILLTSVTHAWIRRQWSTTIDQTDLTISANGSLAFVLSDNSTANSVSLLQYLNFNEGFTLKPVSNYTGESDGFFTLNKDNPEGISYTHLPESNGEAYGYIEFSFSLVGSKTSGAQQSESYVKYVYLKDSYLVANEADIQGALDPAYAMRVSISVPTIQDPIIFKNPVANLDEDEAMMHTGVNTAQSDSKNYLIEGQFYYSDNETKEVANTFTVGDTVYDMTMPGKKVSSFSDFDGGIYVDENDGCRHVTVDKCLCNFSTNASAQITIRIWLEGTDIHCVEKIAGSTLQLHLNFEAVTCSGTKIIELVDEQQ